MIASSLSGCSNDSDNGRDNDPGYTIGVDFMPPEFIYLSEIILFPAMYGGELVFKGYPAENRDGNIFIPSTSLAIATSCTDKEAAWEFMRIFLTEDHQRDNTPWSIPVNKVVFEERLKETMKSLGFSLGGGNNPDDIVEVKGLSMEEVDALRDLINNTTRMRNDDEILWLLISETAADFFNGLITAQDAARIIQSRVTIYLAEQR